MNIVPKPIQPSQAEVKKEVPIQEKQEGRLGATKVSTQPNVKSTPIPLGQEVSDLARAELRKELAPKLTPRVKILQEKIGGMAPPEMKTELTQKQKDLAEVKEKMRELHRSIPDLKPGHTGRKPSEGGESRKRVGLSQEAPVLSTQQKPEIAIRVTQESPAYLERKGQREQITQQIDLKTKQGVGANRVAAKTQAYLMAATAHAQGVAMKDLMPKNKSPQDQFLAMNKSLQGVLEEAKLDNPDDCFLLSELAGLMNKGFSASSGGIGSFQNPGWNDEWSRLGSKDKNDKLYNFKWDKPTDLTWKDTGISLEDMKKIVGRDDLTEKSLEQKLEGKFLTKIESSPEYSKYDIQGVLNNRNAANLENNKKLKDSFKKMLAYYDNNLAQHFDAIKRHPAGVELASIQLQATLGQLMHDFVLDPSKQSRDILKSKMVSSGLIDEKVFNVLANYEKSMRDNPLLAEAPNMMIKSDITSQLKDQKKEEMLGFLKEELKASAQSTNTEIDSEELAQLAGRVLDTYIEKIGRLQTKSVMSGERGRSGTMYLTSEKAAEKTGEVGKFIAGAAGEKNTFAVMPNRSDDKFATEWAGETLGDYQTQRFNKAAEGERGILKHGSAPTTILRLGRGLDTALVDFANNPGVLLQSGIDENLKGKKGKEATILGEFRKRLDESQNKEKLKGIIGDIDITFNKATKQKMPLKEMASMESVASIMSENDLRTICSISGTTVDVIAGMSLSMGKEELNRLLQPLTAYAALPSPREPPVDLNTPEGRNYQEFKKAFTAISFFMQSGQYHTAGEVLGGLFIAGRATLDKTENENIPETFRMFKSLMEEFSKHPEHFIAVNDKDRSKIDNKLPEFMDQLKKKGEGRIRAHIRESE